MNKIITFLSVLFFILCIAAANAVTIMQSVNIYTGAVTVTIPVSEEDVYYTRDYTQNKIHFDFATSTDQAFFGIAAPIGQTIQTGTYYTNLNIYQTYPNQPQLEWGTVDGVWDSGNPDGGCWFNVLELNRYRSHGGLGGVEYVNFAVDAYDGNGNFVSFRYDSAIPVSQVPEPGALVISFVSLLLFISRRKRLEKKKH
jgi:hypothetical protein